MTDPHGLPPSWRWLDTSDQTGEDNSFEAQRDNPDAPGHPDSLFVFDGGWREHKGPVLGIGGYGFAEEAESWFVPLDAIAAVLRRCGWTVVPPERRP